ncbi:peptide chain release factor N(5)-glutamine methyltransferase [Acetobacter orleanensis]|uniref:peptide chain release factor N(5)-glutamine methyltransferase n=1 Tax=Acetobacter orleanensis TaxID=104099 RepID=A0A4Y3TIX1_9PROT|nr:peptide chain release factor N(5)-glutamine methyltransferase [Acetobacter orleanensis]KXV62005.1 SAM-dependent methyltransferase [Acetobacter orleanensis]PCD80339.1 protein-(glutamine-N5) methyltransferase, release factor-specific [Acetobacter orleanensis]GAN68908.1 protein methyltransferase HemK [Acetobacter orleanensis JCM 7639]GBR30772.1 modification methylase HemK [Acetobacter orleanensis NRIC 0473]GEB81684.1 release factor glutamine methyltransferase [Acetobacter orleanensis]
MTRAENDQTCQPLDSLLALGTRHLAEAGIEGPRREARLLLTYALGLTPEQMLSRSPRDLVPEQPFLTYLARRAAREPMAFITGSQGFWTLDLAVSPATLVPRGDSETLLSCLLDYCPDTQSRKAMLDLGTGTGCLLLAALAEYPQAWGIGVDINPAAAVLAQENAVRCGLADRAMFMAGVWDNALHGQRFDVVLSNPPYIPTADLAALMPEVRVHEPVAALDGGADGMEAYRVLCARMPHLLAPGGVAIFEIGVGQGDDLRAVAVKAGLDVVEIRSDFGDVPRAAVLRVCRETGA